MHTTVARQPIFDVNLKTHAYELLFRSGTANAFAGTDGNQATSSVISDTFFDIGLTNITGGHPAFINFTRDLLLREFAHLVPNDWLVVELLEDVEPDAEVINACKVLKEKGYLLALDDFEDRPDYEPLIAMADVIKVDFMLMALDKRKEMADRFLPRGIKLLAEKVETQEEFEQAREMGYSYFQGYFFSKPQMMEKREVSESKLVKLQLLQEVNQPKLDFTASANIMKHDVALTFKFLKYINSAAFGLRNEIKTVDRAITLLGEKNFRRWVSLITLAHMAEDKPSELMVSSVVRGKFCELMGAQIGMEPRSQDLFMVGMFSVIDAIMDQPMDVLLTDLPLQEDVTATLLGEKNILRPVYDTMLSFETGDWQRYSQFEQALKLNESAISDIYRTSLEWAHQVLPQV